MSPKGLSERSISGNRLNAYSAAIQLNERSRTVAVHQNGNIGLAGRGDSTGRILRDYEVVGKV